jgi:putative transcriptional regulator
MNYFALESVCGNNVREDISSMFRIFLLTEKRSAMNYLKGQLLLASAHLTDPNFSQTVIFLIEHDENGAFGVVLNRPSNRTVGEIWDEQMEPIFGGEQAINLGGPVLGPILALHGEMSLAEAEISPGIFLAVQRDTLDQLVRLPGRTVRLFSGYAGWGQGQLENELEEGGWITTAATEAYLFEGTKDLWHQIGRDITQNVLGGAEKIKHVPDDPSVN